MVEADARQIKGRRGHVFVNLERCKGCGLCIEFCPLQVLELSNDFSLQGYHYPVVKHPHLCTGCDQCGAFCPDFAIFGMRI